MEMGFAVTIVPDSTVGFIMEKVDYVLVGAEAVVENGGIINKVRRHAHGSSFGATGWEGTAAPFLFPRERAAFAARRCFHYVEAQRGMTHKQTSRVCPYRISGGYEHDRDRGEGGEQACIRRRGVVQVCAHVPVATG